MSGSRTVRMHALLVVNPPPTKWRGRMNECTANGGVAATITWFDTNACGAFGL